MVAGPGFEQSVILLQILAIGYGANALGGPASQTGAGIGRPEFDMRSTVLLCVLSPVLGIILVRQFGAAGAAAGTTLALIVASAYLLFTFHRNYVRMSLKGMFPAIHLRPALAGMIAVCAVVAFHHAFPLRICWGNPGISYLRDWLWISLSLLRFMLSS